MWGRRQGTITRGKDFLFNAYLKKGVYQVFHRVLKPNPKVDSAEANSVFKRNSMEVWHRRTSHVSPAIMIHTCKEGGARGLPMLSDINFKCVQCRINKHKKVSFKPTGHICSDGPLDLLFTDIWGPN